jgi:hypothetical protein
MQPAAALVYMGHGINLALYTTKFNYMQILIRIWTFGLVLVSGQWQNACRVSNVVAGLAQMTFSCMLMDHLHAKRARVRMSALLNGICKGGLSVAIWFLFYFWCLWSTRVATIHGVVVTIRFIWIYIYIHALFCTKLLYWTKFSIVQYSRFSIVQFSIFEVLADWYWTWFSSTQYFFRSVLACDVE